MREIFHIHFFIISRYFIIMQILKTIVLKLLKIKKIDSLKMLTLHI